MKPTLPKGVRDFSPEQANKRTYIFNTIREVFIRYGYQPIETPVMESLATLTGKYGEEGDRLLFKVLNNGDFLADADPTLLQKKDSNGVLSAISKRGLRYDLTVPFARFVVQHQNELAFPFKRYHIAPVWRADRPQKGRYQEFYQCDVDVVGSSSLMYEAELVQIYDEVFAKLDLPVTIKINNRKILAAMARVAGIAEKMVEMTVAIDKLDKIGIEGVRNELRTRGIAEHAIETIERILQTKSLEGLKQEFSKTEIGKKGIEELETFFNYFEACARPVGHDGLPINDVQLDVTLARGLNYYTGCIFEVKAKGVEMGSIGGGGRYDDLTGMFGLAGVSGVGVSFGAERIYDVLEELHKFPKNMATALRLLLVTFDEETHRYAFKCLATLRKAGINADLYPEPTKLKKQMKYADDLKVPFVAIIGSEEMENQLFSLKNMTTGEQQKLSFDDLLRACGNPLSV